MTELTTVADRRRELGAFLRARREVQNPTALGMPLATRRRTPGLRREEVAQLCGMSTTWYTWMEQGRDVSASAGALARLATVLRLSRAERAYLFGLAGKRDPTPLGTEPEQIPSGLLACVHAITAPAYVLDHTWTARSWNAAAEKLFVDWLGSRAERNLLRFIFLQPAARTFIRDWEARGRRVAAEFRASTSVHLDDPAVRALIAGLRRESPAFAQFWDQHGVLEREGGERTFNHPQLGFLRYQQVTFDLASHPDLKLTILVREGGAKPAAVRTARPARRRRSAG